MIFDAIIGIVVTIFSSILSLFPSADPEVLTNIHSGIYNLKTLIAGYNWIVPVNQYEMILATFISYLVLLGLVRLIRWIGSILTLNFFH